MARKYELRERAESVAATRERIVEATVALHEQLGPARTTISAIADRANVQRLTVYRHFPDERSLFTACSAHWTSRHPRPDAATWQSIGDPRERLSSALPRHLRVLPPDRGDDRPRAPRSARVAGAPRSRRAPRRSTGSTYATCSTRAGRPVAASATWCVQPSATRSHSTPGARSPGAKVSATRQRPPRWSNSSALSASRNSRTSFEPGSNEVRTWFERHRHDEEYDDGDELRCGSRWRSRSTRSTCTGRATRQTSSLEQDRHPQRPGVGEVRTAIPLPRNAVRTSSPGTELVPVRGDDDHLVGGQLPGGRGHGDGVLDRRAGGGVAEQRHVRASPRSAHQLGFAAAARPPRPARENHRASTGSQLLAAPQAQCADRIENIGAPAGVPEYRDDANRISHARSGAAHDRTRTASRSPSPRA